MACSRFGLEMSYDNLQRYRLQSMSRLELMVYKNAHIKTRALSFKLSQIRFKKLSGHPYFYRNELFVNIETLQNKPFNKSLYTVLVLAPQELHFLRKLRYANIFAGLHLLDAYSEDKRRFSSSTNLIWKAFTISRCNFVDWTQTVWKCLRYQMYPLSAEISAWGVSPKTDILSERL